MINLIYNINMLHIIGLNYVKKKYLIQCNFVDKSFNKIHKFRMPMSDELLTRVI
jgi:hypothetical protein